MSKYVRYRSLQGKIWCFAVVMQCKPCSITIRKNYSTWRISCTITPLPFAALARVSTLMHLSELWTIDKPWLHGQVSNL